MLARLSRIAAHWAVLGGLILVAIVLVTSTNIALFGADRIAGLWGSDVAGLSGYEDFVRLAISSAGLMFFPWCQARRGHVAVDLFVELLPVRARRELDRLWLALSAALAVFLLDWMVTGMLETRSDGVLSPILGWPEWPFYIPGLISLALWAAVAAAQAVIDPHAESDHVDV